MLAGAAGAAPPPNDPERVAASINASHEALLRAGRLRLAPFAHAMVEGFFEHGLYGRMATHFPTDTWQVERCVTYCPPGNRSNIKSAKGQAAARDPHGAWWPWPEWKEPRHTERRLFWERFYGAMNASATKAAWLTLFAQTLRRRPRWAAGNRHKPWPPDLQSVEMGVDFLQDMRGFSLPPHTDICEKLISILIYLPLEPVDNETEMARVREHGTVMYVPTAAAPRQESDCGETRKTFQGYTEVARAPYAPNSLFAFAPCRRSWHGVAHSRVRRRAIFMWLRMLDRSGPHPANKRLNLAGPCAEQGAVGQAERRMKQCCI